MYGWIWRKLPGGTAWKALESTVLVLLVAGVLVVVVFPWLEPKLPFSGNTVSGDTGDETGEVTPSPSRSATPRPSSTSVPSPGTGGDVLPGE